jgi:hypothetical protein
MIDEVYGSIREMIQSKVNNNQSTISVAEIINGMDQNLVQYLTLAINRLKDEWVVNEDETGGKFEINMKLFELSKIQDKPIQIEEVEAIKTTTVRRDRRSSKYEKQLRVDAKRFTPIIKKIVIDLAEQHFKDQDKETFVFSSHIINRRIREQLGDVFDETLAMRTFVAMKELSKSWILKREIRPTKNIWFVTQKEVQNELQRMHLKTGSREPIEVVTPSVRPRKIAKLH